MTIEFEAKLLKIGNLEIIKIPLSSSQELSSRGMVMVKGKINDIDFKATLEPDGKASHWLEIKPDLSKEIGVDVGEKVSLAIEQSSEWIEPEIPEDIMNEFASSGVLKQWDYLTPKSRWEWLRWIRSTKSPQTRNKRINVASSKLQKGDKNPCCFDTTRSTVTEVSKSGVLLG